MIKNTKNIVINIGPKHLFTTTIFHYLWHLKDNYKIYLLAEKNYLKFQFAQKFFKDFAIEVSYIPSGHNLRQQYLKNNIIKKLIKKVQPKFVFTHNYNYTDGLYLYHYSNKINNCSFFEIQCVKFYLTLEQWNNDVITRKANTLKKKYLFLNKLFKFKISIKVLDMINFFKYFLVYKMIPFLIAFVIFTPLINVYNGKRTNSKLKIKILHYLNIEESLFRYFGYQTIMINHPILRTGDVSLQYLFGKRNEKKILLIAPSWGNINLKNKFNSIKNISEVWNKIIMKIKSKIDIDKVIIKLHPNEEFKFEWQNIIKDLKNNHKELEEVKPFENLEGLIYQSTVVCTDSSTVAWYTSFFSKKISISLDLFNYTGGDAYNGYENLINVIKEIQDLDNIKFFDNRFQKTKELDEVLKF